MPVAKSHPDTELSAGATYSADLKALLEGSDNTNNTKQQRKLEAEFISPEPRFQVD